MQSVTWNGNSYDVPATGDENWGGSTGVDGLLISLAQNGLSKSGGSFELTADVDFGSSFGLKSAYFSSRSSNPASAGVGRLANTEGIYWRNAANSADLGLTVNASNQLLFNGILVSSGSALTASRALVSDGSGLVSVSSVTSTELGYVSGVTSAIQTQITARLQLAGGTMTGVLACAAGSAAAPSITLDTTTGLYKKGTSSLGFATAGTECGFYDSAGLWTFGISGTQSTSAHTVYGRGIDIGYTRANTPAYVQISHTDNSSGAHANFYAYSRGGDAYSTYDCNTTVRWSVGGDISDSGAFKISQSGSIGSGDVLRIDNSTLAFTIGTGTSSTHRLNTTVQTTVGAAGGATALPATPTGYVLININGTNRAIPYYAAS